MAVVSSAPLIQPPSDLQGIAAARALTAPSVTSPVSIVPTAAASATTISPSATAAGQTADVSSVTTIAPQTDIIPVTNILPVLNFLPPAYYDSARDRLVDIYGHGYSGYGGLGSRGDHKGHANSDYGANMVVIPGLASSGAGVGTYGGYAGLGGLRQT
ncbi:hypothetical protein BGZ54_008440 [Gamsiella multidivaricata]|nr:hypothetical protein BGZ54_008440 [Gamsiella multidivaricata]